jgi:hypothetical protein
MFLNMLYSKLGPTTIASASNDISLYPIVSEVAHIFSHSTQEGRAKLKGEMDAACEATGRVMKKRKAEPNENYWVEL